MTRPDYFQDYFVVVLISLLSLYYVYDIRLFKITWKKKKQIKKGWKKNVFQSVTKNDLQLEKKQWPQCRKIFSALEKTLFENPRSIVNLPRHCPSLAHLSCRSNAPKQASPSIIYANEMYPARLDNIPFFFFMVSIPLHPSITKKQSIF